MLNFFDIVPEPGIEGIEIAKSMPWIAAYVVVGVLVCVAVFFIIRAIVKPKK
ncbi:MAG: hypothetical protein AB1Z23_12610 [Eubacteriales bacterium]